MAGINFSIAFPLIGAGVGRLKRDDVIAIMKRVFNERSWDLNIYLVKR